ncbi:MAG: LapA family protein [Luteimonas sp.]|nr:LapA family protein [Luteimonas sp.]
MRLLRILIALLFVALGAAIGGLNPQRVTLDLGFAGIEAGLGVLVLSALLAGAVAGGLILSFGVVVPLRRALGRAQAAAPPSPYDSGA